MTVKVTFDTSSFDELVRRAPRIGYEETRDGLKRFMFGFERAMKTKMAGGRGSIKSRSGVLRASMTTSVRGSSLNRLTVNTGIGSGPASKYVNIQEKGGTIRAKSKKLTIPLDAAKTAGGRLKAKYRNKSNLRLTMRRVGGRLKAFLVDGPKDNPKFIFVLKDQVTLKPKLNFVNTFYEQWKRRGQAIINRIAKNIANRGNRIK